jgi:hypothetical protein
VLGAADEVQATLAGGIRRAGKKMGGTEAARNLAGVSGHENLMSFKRGRYRMVASRPSIP